MADKEVAIKISVETEGGAKSLSELKKEFKATQQELEGLDTSSKKYVQTLEKLGGIKDEIGDLNAEINAFNPEGKIQAFGNVVGGLTSGFQAAQGAAALFGAEGEELQKTLLKVQAASAFADGIKGLMGMSDSFKVLGNVIKANPLMLLASVLIGLGAAMVALKDKIGFVGEAFNMVTGAVNKGIDALKTFTDWLRITSFKSEEAAAKQIKLAEQVGKATEERYTKEIERAKAAGQETIDIEIKKQAALVASLKLQHKDFAQAQEDLLLLVIQRNTKIADENEKAREKEREETKKHNQRMRDIDMSLAESRMAADEAEFVANFERKKEQKIEFDNFEIEQQAFEVERNKTNTDTINAYELEQEKSTFEQKLAMTTASLQATQALVDLGFAYQMRQAQGNQKKELELKKKQFKINKAFALSMSIIDGVGSIMKALNNPYPLNIVLAVAAGIAATANTAKIAMTKFEGGETSGGGGGDLGAAGGGVALAPPTQGSTNLNADGTVKKAVEAKQPTVKAVVTETDITKTQKKVNTIEEQSKL